MRAAIFDIDGTIADCTHRQHFIQGHSRDWDAFYRGMSEDVPRVPVVDVLVAVARASFSIILCTGRPSNYRDETERWLRKHRIPYDKIHFRNEGDHRDDVIVKREMLQAIRRFDEPMFAVEDRARVVAMWREEGLVCFQCAEGNF